MLLRQLGFGVDWKLNTKKIVKANKLTDGLKSNMSKTTGAFSGLGVVGAKSLNKIKDGTKKLTKGFGNVAKKLDKHKAEIGIAFGALSAGIGLSVKEYAKFEKQTAIVGAVSQATGNELAMLENQAKGLSLKTKFSPVEVAKGQEYLARAGFSVAESMESLPSILNLATAENMNLGVASDMVSDVLTGFGAKASKTGLFVDTLTKASTLASTDVKMLGEGMKFVAPVASDLGFTIQDTTSALSLLAASGIKSGMGGRYLRMSLAKLAAPTKEGAKIFKDLKINVSTATGKLKSLPEIVKEINNGMKDLSDIEKQGKLTKLFGAEASTGMSILLNKGAEGVKNFNKKLLDVDDISKKLSDKQLNTLSGQFELLKGSIGLLAVEIGGTLAPVVKTITKGIIKLVNFFSTAPKPIKIVVGVLGGLATAGLGVATAIGFLYAPVTTLIGVLGTGAGVLFGTVIPAVWGFTSALLANPITWIVVGVGLLTAGLIYMAKNWDKVKIIASKAITIISGLWDQLKNKFFGFLAMFKNINIGEVIYNSIKNGIGLAVEGVKLLTSKIRNFLPFSPAKEGALSDLDKSGKAFVRTFSDGLKSEIPLAEKTVSGGTESLNQNITNNRNKNYQNNINRNKSGININFGDIIVNGSVENKENIEKLSNVLEKKIKESLENYIYNQGSAEGLNFV